MSKTLKLLSRVNLKSIIFNFKYFPFKIAIKLPVLISNNIYLHKMGGKVIINGPVKTALIQIGYGKVGISDFKRARGIWQVFGEVTFNGRAFIMHGCKINVGEKGKLTFGENFNMSTEVAIVAEKQITIGNNSGISWESLVMDTDFHHIFDENGQVFNHPKEVIIGHNVWVGCRCTILKGANLPDGSIIAAGSLVTKKLVGNNSIFGGNPMRVLKENITWQY
jgi:acetyltransferase-like isoleucine patch superfamily enzyme